MKEGFFEYVSHVEIVPMSKIRYDAHRSSIAAVGELTNCPPGTEAKLIIKS